ncbi:hypothetical protein [Streptomyces venezuelae]|uniref:hypothetical protein n=1 Tax=Streptomyces venezuelae TaxID=54571 RepID=UPI0009030457|nr:hypothetical protein [Streptomyces venezuelae]APE26764.1 hypothetical protein vnz_37265 [Streptomyces venezuelae]
MNSWTRASRTAWRTDSSDSARRGRLQRGLGGRFLPGRAAVRLLRLDRVDALRPGLPPVVGPQPGCGRRHRGGDGGGVFVAGH